METVVNKEYQELVDKINRVINTSNHLSDDNRKRLREVRDVIICLGSRPKLNEKVQQFIDITTDMSKIYAAKNHDYGNSFEQSCDKFGIIASVVRLEDKMNRIESLTVQKAKVKDESIKDTLLDLANYSIMTVMWLNNKQ